MRWRDPISRRDGVRLRGLLCFLGAAVVAMIAAHGALDVAAAGVTQPPASSTALHAQPCLDERPGHVTRACPAESPRTLPVAAPASPTLRCLPVRPAGDLRAPASTPPGHLRPRLAQLAVYRT
jgi:hypothetical protein